MAVEQPVVVDKTEPSIVGIVAESVVAGRLELESWLVGHRLELESAEADRLEVLESVVVDRLELES